MAAETVAPSTANGTNTSTSNNSPAQSKELSPSVAAAELKKAEGNQYYKIKDYTNAEKKYTEAIQLDPTNELYYGNRCACYLMLKQYSKALADAQKAVSINETFVKGHLREAKAHLFIGDFSASVKCLNKVKLLEPSNPEIAKEWSTLEQLMKLEEEARNAFSKTDHRTVIYHMNRAQTDFGIDCVRFSLYKAESLCYLKRYQEAQDIVSEILRSDSTNADALYIRGLTLYYQDQVDKSFTHFRMALQLNPDLSQAKEIFKMAKNLKSMKEQGNAAYNSNDLVKAEKIYSDALQIDPVNTLVNAKLFFNRAVVYAKRNMIQEAIDDCTSAIGLDENYVKAYLKRAKLYLDSERYEESVRDYEAVFQRERSREVKELLDKAKLELKKSQRKDYYKILGVSKSASTEEIKKAYKQRCLEHHPDRHSSATEELKKLNEKKFKECGEAYGVLSDPKKKARFDNGLDAETGHGCGGAYDIDPSNIFASFFAGGGGPAGFDGAGFGGSPFGGGTSSHHGGGHSYQFHFA